MPRLYDLLVGFLTGMLITSAVALALAWSTAADARARQRQFDADAVTQQTLEERVEWLEARRALCTASDELTRSNFGMANVAISRAGNVLGGLDPTLMTRLQALSVSPEGDLDQQRHSVATLGAAVDARIP